MEDILSDVPSITISLFIMRGGDPKYLEDYCKLSMSLGKYQKYNNNTIFKKMEIIKKKNKGDFSLARSQSFQELVYTTLCLATDALQENYTARGHNLRF